MPKISEVKFGLNLATYTSDHPVAVWPFGSVLPLVVGNVYPEEVEQELLKSPYIDEIMVYGKKISPFVEEVHALVYCNQDSIDLYAKERSIEHLTVGDIEDIIKSEIRRYGKNLAEYKRVKKFRIREEPFPKTSTRKIKRYALGDEIAVDH